MFTFHHPRPVTSRRAVPVLAVRQQAPDRIVAGGVLVIDLPAVPCAAGPAGSTVVVRATPAPDAGAPPA